MPHKECKFCGIRSTIVTANGIVEDKEVRDSFCPNSKYGSHDFREVPD